MKVSSIVLALTAAAIATAPAFAGTVYDTTTVGTDNSLSIGVGTTGPGMSGYLHQGIQDRPIDETSLTDGKSPNRRTTKNGFSRRPVYNNYADLALPHIR